jgi:putative transposase
VTVSLADARCQSAVPQTWDACGSEKGSNGSLFSSLPGLTRQSMLRSRFDGRTRSQIVGWVERSETHQAAFRIVMTSYRRNFVPGASYFFTVNLANRRSRVLTTQIDLLRSAFRYGRARRPFITEAVVVLPDHLHAIWTLPAGDADFAIRWRLIKSMFSRSIPPLERVSESRKAKGERGIWQRRYWEHTIRDDGDFARHVDYIHYNPVKHRHVTRVVDWPYSSFHRMVRLGIYPTDWGGDAREIKAAYGER